jgi:hypothetical protein
MAGLATGCIGNALPYVEFAFTWCLHAVLLQASISGTPDSPLQVGRDSDSGPGPYSTMGGCAWRKGLEAGKAC